MPDSRLYRGDADDEVADAAVAAERGTPRWVKVIGIIALVILVMLLVALLSGGKHGPGRHLGDTGRHTTVALGPSAVDHPPAPTTARL